MPDPRRPLRPSQKPLRWLDTGTLRGTESLVPGTWLQPSWGFLAEPDSWTPL